MSVGVPSLHLVLRLDRGADDLLGRNAVDALGPGPHEVDAAAGDDERLEAVGAQVGEHLEHRLVDEIGVEPLEARMPRGGEPVARRSSANSSVVMPAWVAINDLHQAFSPPAASGLEVAGEHGREGLLVFHSGMLRRQRLRPGRRRRRAACTSAARPRACRRCRTWRCAPRAGRSRGLPRGDRGDEVDDRLAWPRRRSTTAADRPPAATAPTTRAGTPRSRRSRSTRSGRAGPRRLATPVAAHDPNDFLDDVHGDLGIGRPSDHGAFRARPPTARRTPRALSSRSISQAPGRDCDRTRCAGGARSAARRRQRFHHTSEKLAAFWRGGNSLNVFMKFPTYV